MGSAGPLVAAWLPVDVDWLGMGLHLNLSGPGEPMRTNPKAGHTGVVSWSLNPSDFRLQASELDP